MVVKEKEGNMKKEVESTKESFERNTLYFFKRGLSCPGRPVHRIRQISNERVSPTVGIFIKMFSLIENGLSTDFCVFRGRIEEEWYEFTMTHEQFILFRKTNSSPSR